MNRAGIISTAAIGITLVLLTMPLYADTTLPANLSLHYSVSYGGMPVGTSIRTLARDEDGIYQHRMHTKPGGLARMFTKVEWFEEGRFRIQNNAVVPLSYLKYRARASKPHRHGATFDWEKKQITYSDGRTQAIQAETKDQSSILFAFMLKPPRQEGEHNLYLTNGKKIQPYRYRYVRHETIATSLGKLDTLVIQWFSEPGSEDEQISTVWLAIDKRYLPVKITSVEDGKTATMILDKVSGL